MLSVCLQETVEDIDKNKDGFVDLDEYIRNYYTLYFFCWGSGNVVLFSLKTKDSSRGSFQAICTAQKTIRIKRANQIG